MRKFVLKSGAEVTEEYKRKRKNRNKKARKAKRNKKRR